MQPLLPAAAAEPSHNTCFLQEPMPWSALALRILGLSIALPLGGAAYFCFLPIAFSPTNKEYQDMAIAGACFGETTAIIFSSILLSDNCKAKRNTHSRAAITPDPEAPGNPAQ